VTAPKTPKLSAQAIRLLRRVQEHILSDPRRFNMDYWKRHVSLARIAAGEDCIFGIESAKDVPPCGTIACIAGWTALLGTPPGNRPLLWSKVRTCATELLGLKPLLDERGFSYGSDYRLFFEENWPERFYHRFRLATSRRQRARIAAQRIDHFIKTGGAE